MTGRSSQSGRGRRSSPAGRTACGCADGENYFHGCSPLAIVSIAHFGLHPSDSGAGSDEPMLYTCKSRKTPIDIYASNAWIPMSTTVKSVTHLVFNERPTPLRELNRRLND